MRKFAGLVSKPNYDNTKGLWYMTNKYNLIKNNNKTL